MTQHLGPLEFKWKEVRKILVAASIYALTDHKSEFVAGQLNTLLAEKLQELLYNIEWDRECDCCNNNRAIIEKLEKK